MATTKISLQEESVLKLVLEFLTARKYYKSARSLEKETGVSTNPFSENVNFLRDLVLDGDWPAVREFGEPLADMPAFEYRRFNFLVARQEYLEILFEKCEGNIKDEHVLRDRLLSCLQNLERYCKYKDEYNKLYWYLSVPSLRTEPEFCNWSVDLSRMLLFEEMLELLKQFIPTGEQHLCKNNLGSEDRLLSLLFKGSLYENCIEFCQKQAMGKSGDHSLTDVKVDLFRKQSLKSTGNFYSWLHSLSKDSFVVPFEELNFDVQLEKRKQTRVDVKNNSLSQSLTIELNSPSKAFVQRGRDERRKRFSEYPQSKPMVLAFDARDVSQSFAEFEFAENGDEQLPMAGGPNMASNDQELFLRNGEVERLGGYVLPRKTVESPRKVRRDQQDLVLQQLEEHKQRQRELYEQLAESASLARGGGQIKDTKTNIIPDESAKSLEAVKKSIQSLKLLTESFESPKGTQPDTKDDVFRQVEVKNHMLRTDERNDSQKMAPQYRPNMSSISSEIPTRKSSSSTPGSATLPKTPVNTCLPPGMVRLTDGSGTFNTSTPKAERQSFTTPLPASPVTSEQRFSRKDVPLRQTQQRNSTQEANVRPDVGGQTPKETSSDTRQFAVRRSLVNTVFQNENAMNPDTRPTLTNNIDASDNHSPRKPNANVHPAMKTVHTKEKLGSDPKESDFQTFAMGNNLKDSRFQSMANTDGKIDRHFPATEETNPKNSKFQNYSTPRKFQSSVDSRSSRPIATDLKDPRFQDKSGLKDTRSAAMSSQATANSTLSHAKGVPQNTNSAPLKFQKSAMLVDTQAIRAVVFHPGGKYFAVGTNSKALKLCRTRDMHEYHHYERDEQDTPELEVVCQKTSIHKGSVYCVAFSPNGDIIATGSNDKTIKLSRFDEDNPVILEDGMELAIHNATVRDLTFVHTAAGSHPVLASGGAGGGLVHLSDCLTGQTVSSLQGHAGNVMAVFASNQAHLLCSGSADKTVRMWDLRMAKCIEVIPTSSCVTSVCFNYGGTHSLLLASADDNGQCIVYDVGARKSVTSFNPHEMDCRSIRFSPDSKHVLTGSYDACVAITAVQYNSAEMLSDSRIVARHKDKVIQCRWHPSEYAFVSSSADRSVVLWEQTPR